MNEKSKIDFQQVSKDLKTKYIGKNYMYFDTIDSTNIQCKKELNKNFIDGLVVVAEEQTLGRGRLGRYWESPKSTGIWMSIGLKPKIAPIMASRATLIGAAAVYLALKEMNIKVGIKWPNDIVIDGKKICGILTEMNTIGDKINYIVMGIGINVNMEKFPEEIKEKATSLKNVVGQQVNRNILIGKILNNLESLYEDFKENGDISEAIKVCREGSVLIGKEVKLINGQSDTLVIVVDIGDEGELIVRYKDGIIDKIISGEVSVRGLNGYI